MTKMIASYFHDFMSHQSIPADQSTPNESLLFKLIRKVFCLATGGLATQTYDDSGTKNENILLRGRRITKDTLRSFYFRCHK